MGKHMNQKTRCAVLVAMTVAAAARAEVKASFAGRLVVDSPVSLELAAKGALAPWKMMNASGMTEREDGTRDFAFSAPDEPRVAGTFKVGPGQSEGEVDAEWTFTPEADVRMNMFGLMGDLKMSDYSEGSLVVDGEHVRLPTTGRSENICRYAVSRIEISDKSGGRRLAFSLKAPVGLFIQYWGGKTMSLRLILPPDDAATKTYRGGVRKSIAFSLAGAGRLRKTALSQVSVSAGKEWLPFDVPEEVAEGSVLDFSRMRPTGKPAGKFGRLVARGAHFEFEGLPGVSQRFYGVNLCGTANYPETMEAARKIARTIARVGYNSVRIHHHDGGCVDKDDPAHTRLDEAQMRKMDFLVAACVEEGLYISTDLFVSRTHMPIAWRAVGVDRNGTMTMQDYKRSVYVHEGVYSNYLAFAANWLSHTNSVTGRRYADEPAIAWISLVNEGNIDEVSAFDCQSRPGWQEKWERWLSRKKAAEPGKWDDITTAIPNGLGRDRQGRAFLRFLQDVESRFVARTRAFLRGLGCMALVTDMNNGQCRTAAFELPRGESCDYVDIHFYVDHPAFLEKDWRLPSWCPNSNPFKGERMGAAPVSAMRILERPFTVSEYNFSGPGRFRGVGGIAAGAEAALQDWDGLWRFAWSHNNVSAAHVGRHTAGYFDIASDPMQLASERASVCLFLRRDMEPLGRTYAVTLPRDRITSPDCQTGVSMVADWTWAAWVAKIGAAMGGEVPAGAVHAGDFDVAYMKTSDDARRDLSLGSGPVVGGGGVAVDGERGSFMVSSPRTCGVFAEQGKVVGESFRAKILGSPATVWASSLDGMPLKSSKRMLVTHLTDVQNSGARYADTEMTILKDFGRLPYLMRAGVAGIGIRVDGGAYAVFALNADGTRRSAVQSSVKDGWLRFVCDTGMEDGRATYLYEVVKE